jgi:hypothetical protein
MEPSSRVRLYVHVKFKRTNIIWLRFFAFSDGKRSFHEIIAFPKPFKKPPLVFAFINGFQFIRGYNFILSVETSAPSLLTFALNIGMQQKFYPVDTDQ